MNSTEAATGKADTYPDKHAVVCAGRLQEYRWASSRESLRF